MPDPNETKEKPQPERPFTRLTNAKVDGWRWFEFPDPDIHRVGGLLETVHGGVVAWLFHYPDRQMVRLQTVLQPRERLEIQHLPILARAQGDSFLSRIQPDLEDRHILIQVGCPYYDDSSAEATLTVLTREMRAVVENERMQEIVGEI